MDIAQYLEYARSDEAFAVLFVKKYLTQADGSVWIDILDCHAPAGYETEQLMFKSVDCELFPRKTVPAYPDRRQFRSNQDYVMACRAITWETAQRDIATLRRRKYIGRKYRIRGVSYPAHAGFRAPVRPDPDKFFVESAPPEIKALAKNLDDRTDPLWDHALQYVNPIYGYDPAAPENNGYRFKILGIKRI